MQDMKWMRKTRRICQAVALTLFPLTPVQIDCIKDFISHPFPDFIRFVIEGGVATNERYET